MDLDKSRYLLAIADLKSFSRAAEACHISQPALTRYVQGLERELGVTLFDRSFSPVQLTYAGERYLKGLKRMMKLKEELDLEMAEIAVQKKERLVVGMHPTRSYTWLPRVVPAYQNLRPAVEIRLTEGNCMELQQKLRKDLIDLIFICAEPILDEDIHFVPLCSEEMALVVSRQASALRHLSLPPNEKGILQYIPPRVVEQIPFISPSPIHGTWHLAQELFRQSQIQPQAVMELENVSAVYRLAPESKGFALAPVSVTLEERFDQEPLFCSMDHQIPRRLLGLAYRKGKNLPPAAVDFIQVAKEAIPRYLDENMPAFQIRYDIACQEP